MTQNATDDGRKADAGCTHILYKLTHELSAQVSSNCTCLQKGMLGHGKGLNWQFDSKRNITYITLRFLLRTAKTNNN